MTPPPRITPDDVAAFVAREERRPAVWGVSDCSLRLGDWTREAVGIDAAAGLRGTYNTALECARLLRRAGGLVAVVDGLAERADFRRTDISSMPGVGAVGVVGEPGRLFHQWGAISDGTFWVVFHFSGVDWLRADQFPPLTSWEIA